MPSCRSSTRRAPACRARASAWSRSASSIRARLSGAAPDPFLAAFVDLFLPQRDALLELVDRVLARGERVPPVRRRDCDPGRRLADPDAADAMVDRDAGQLVPCAERVRDLAHHLFGHSLVGLV